MLKVLFGDPHPYKFSHPIYSFDRVQKNFEGKLVGADRTKDLAVLKVCLV